MSFIKISCNLPTQLGNILDVHARFAILQSIGDEFQQVYIFPIRKLNNDTDFALGGDIQRELNFQ